METFVQDVRYAFRQVGRSPGFSLVVAVTVALGVGATTVILSLADALVLRPLPVAEPGRLVGMVEVREQGARPYTFSYARIQEFREGAGDVVRIGAHGMFGLAMQGPDEARVLMGGFVTGDYFELLGLAPAHGRFFAAAEETPGVPEPVAVLSHRLWQREFGGAEDVIGRTLRLNSRSVTVIGVAPAGFHGLERGVATDVWLPIPTAAVLSPDSDVDHPERWRWLVVVGRLAPGFEASAAEAVLGGIARSMDEASQQPAGVTGVQVFRLTGLQPDMVTPAKLFFALLLAAAGLVLVIGCVNVAGMLMARGAARRREVGVRLALGAGRRRLVGQLLTETSVLFALGGLGGVLLAAWTARFLAVLPQRLPGELSLLNLDIRIDWRIAAFGMVIALGTALLFGLAPALQASRPEVLSALKEGGAATVRRSRLRDAFVAGQIAACVLLLASAGLLARSLQHGLDIDLGMDPRGVVMGGLNVTPHGYDADRGRIFFRELRDRLAAHPDVNAVTYAGHVPLTFSEIVYGVGIPGHEPPPGRQTFLIDGNVVGPDYFRTLRIPVEGRGFTAADEPESPRVAVVNRTMANRFWPDGDALGQHVTMSGAQVEIVGIAADAKYNQLTEAAIPYIYVPFEQSYQGNMVVHVRTTGSPAQAIGLIRREAARLDAGVPLLAPASLERAVRITLLPQRVAATVVGALGGLGLLLAVVGLYGILAYMVGQRMREFGVRMAVGARAVDLYRIVLRQAGGLLLAGVAAGLLLALAATRLLAPLLLDLHPTDPFTLGLVVLLLALATLPAVLAPARRASRVDPIITLKAER
jgi:putative ABC transport system permease protein